MQLYCYRLRHFHDLETMLEELSALVDKTTLLGMYHEATKYKHSFLNIDLMETELTKMFSIRFDKIILIE